MFVLPLRSLNDIVLTLYFLQNPGPLDVPALNSALSIARPLWLEYLNRIPNPEHIYLVQYFIFITLLVTFIVFLSFLFSPINPSAEKVTSYECGFEPFGDARTTFDVHFYLVGILFLIFDLEVVYLFPWLFSFVVETNFVYGNLVSMILFLIFLGIGFVYEWRQNALVWAPVHVTPIVAVPDRTTVHD